MTDYNYHILLVEDDASHTELIKRCFERVPLQTTIHCLADGEQALRHILYPLRDSQEPALEYDLIILDQRLPKVNGLEVLKTLNEQGLTAKKPVVIFSTSSAESDYDLAMSLGARAYISKPVGYQDFLAAIQKMTYYLTEKNH